ncbi:MAG TPA: thioredoxin domain-containing protein, partial [Acidimicrobiia bacterium]|nr:thioredoxin domain-containing protein [Acidimicrobiia bacterium]
MPNRLAASTSPYLLQHRDNPVDWWEWSDEAFAEAAERDVPVLLSVGYSACHWCHVMAHESFEDAKTAEEMNRNFVNIKVDREERPDVDSIYMEAVQAMTGQGGWPMTVWMTPDRKPFFAGTYFPKEPHHGMASFEQVMDAVSEAWTNNREEIGEQADRLVEAISGEIPTGEVPDGTTLGRAVEALLSQYDATFGGFGGAPKFPQQPVLEFLLRWKAVDGSVDNPIRTTLTRIADGGIHDHLAGGFARYSVDRKWLVPHFEKMLYDNAQLARLYLWAGIELDEPRFVAVARKTLDYLVTDMRHHDGGFFSAEDADSEGVEGKFYVWSLAEIGEVLGDDAPAAAAYYGVTPEGNFEEENILHLSPERAVPENLEEINQKLLDRRNLRVRPGLDDKVVAAWNGMAIRAFAEAGA